MEESAIALGALAMMPPTLAGYWIRRAVSSGKLASGGSLFYLPGRTAVFTGEDERLRDAILDAYKAAGLKNPPKTDKVYAQLNANKGDAHKMIRVLTQSGDLVSLAPDYTLHKDALSEARAILVKELEAGGSIETAKYRDLLGVGRKAAIDILEWFDRDGLTRRIGNKRVLRESSTPDGQLRTP